VHGPESHMPDISCCFRCNPSNTNLKCIYIYLRYMQKYGVFETKYTSTTKKLCHTLPHLLASSQTMQQTTHCLHPEVGISFLQQHHGRFTHKSQRSRNTQDICWAWEVLIKWCHLSVINSCLGMESET